MTIATFLTGSLISIRALEKDDANTAEAWYPALHGTNASRGEALLKEEQESARQRRRLAIVRTDSGELVGGLSLHLRAMHADVNMTFARRLEGASGEAEAMRAEVLRLVLPWLRDEAEFSVIAVELASDWTQAIAAAEELGLRCETRLREWFARPGGRADLLIYYALNPFWEKPEGQAPRAAMGLIATADRSDATGDVANASA